MAETPRWALEKIREAKEQGLTELDLRRSYRSDDEELTEIPSEVFNIDQLENLYLDNNEIYVISSDILKLRNLKRIRMQNNHIANIPNFISSLVGLIELNLWGNELVEIPDSLFHLKSLEVLTLSNNSIKYLPKLIGQLSNLIVLNLDNNRITDLPEELALLSGLTKLRLERNYLESVPECISQLKNLEALDLGGNLISVIPDFIYDLTSMRDLSFSNDRYGYANDSNKNTSTNKITQLYPEILNLGFLETFRVRNNPIETPPPEVVEEGIEAIRNYFRQLEAEGTDHLYEAKLLILGEPGAGKTSLAKKIENPEYKLRSAEKSTEGIDVIRWNFTMENGRDFRVNIWDFGGQEIYKATHQFFLTKRSLYAVVADMREESTDFFYWLNVVDLLTDGSPTLIIKNEKQERHREINEHQLNEQFKNLEDVLETNLANNSGLDEIIKAVKYHIVRLPLVGTALPKTWVNVRQALEDDDRDYISRDEFLELCDRNGFKGYKDKLQLSGYLHDLGVILHFQEDAILNNTVILNPKWGTDAVYKVLDNQKVLRNYGEFKWDDLAEIWPEDEYAAKFHELLQLMVNFELCYAIPGSPDTYIAPQLLTENQPNYEWDDANNLVLRYSYEFMPNGILTRFIVAMHTDIEDQKNVWKSGVVLSKDNTKAEVIEQYGRREIRVRISGRQKKDMMTVVVHELDKIHDSFNSLKYDKLIPCNCSNCKDNQEPHFHSFEKLRDFHANKEPTIQCQEPPYEMVSVPGLIDDVMEYSPNPQKEERELYGEGYEGGGVSFNAPIDKVILQQSGRGTNVVRDESSTGSQVVTKSSWANGSFYLSSFVVVVVALSVLANVVQWYALIPIILAAIILVPIIGGLQLRQDDSLSEKGFMELIRIVIKQLPLIGKVASKTPSGE